MNPTARISLLLGALILLVFGIVCLKQQLGTGPTPPAFVPSSSDRRDTDLGGSAGHQPTILSSEPNGEHDLNASPRLREVSPIPYDEPQSTPIDYPVNTTQPDLPREVLPVWNETDEPAPAYRDFPGTADAATLLEPVEINSPVAESRISVMPTTTVTTLGDSLWMISERVYGRGDYYKALFLHNRELLPRPDRIAAGIELSAPSLEELRQRFPHACPPTADPPVPTRGG